LAFLSRHLSGPPLATWLERLGAEALARALEAEADDAFLLFAVPHEEGRARWAALGGVSAFLSRDVRAQIQAYLLLQHPPERGLRLPAEEASSVFRQALRLEPRLDGPLEKLHQAAGSLAEELVAHLAETTEVWLTTPSKSGPRSPLGAEVLRLVALRHGTADVVATWSRLPAPKLRPLLDAWAELQLPHGLEQALAVALEDHASPTVAAWARARRPRLATRPPSLALPAARDGRRAVPAALSRAVAKASSEADLEAALRPLLGRPHRGLAAACEGRSPAPSIALSVCLLGCHDEPADVLAVLDGCWDDGAPFLSSATAAWGTVDDLPVIGHAVLWRYERHALAVGRTATDTGLVAFLETASRVRPARLAHDLFWAVARSLGIWRRRSAGRLDDVEEADLDALVAHLPTAHGEPAAAALVTLHQAGRHPERFLALRERVLEVLPDLSDPVRDRLAPYVRLDGLAPRETLPLVQRASASTLERARCSDDVDELLAICREPDPGVVEPAALRLVELGAEARLVALLEAEAPPAAADAVAGAVSFFGDGAALDRARALATDGSRPPVLRFVLALALFVGGDGEALATAIDVLLEPLAPGAPSWLHHRRWDRLREDAGPRLDPAVLLRSPHVHAYRWALKEVLRREGPERQGLLRDFLDRGASRVSSSRLDAARALEAIGDDHAFPLLLASALTEATPLTLRGPAADELVDAVLFGGSEVMEERAAWLLLNAPGDPLAERMDAAIRLYAGARSASARTRLLQRVAPFLRASAALRPLAESFAWGREVARELTGRAISVHITGGESLGFTRIGSSQIFVNPRPLLDGERHGRQLVEGLVLHELGHQQQHHSEAHQEVWKTAVDEGIHSLLNLVLDEHLERNLRAHDRAYGDRLKRLAAYAFQHARRSLPVDVLLDLVGPRAVAVLGRTPLMASRRRGCLRVDNGALLAGLERRGHPFAAFVRALRMGLGNRRGDARVGEGLALFGRRFRKLDAEALLEVARALQRLFGLDAGQLAQIFGGHETLEDGEGDAPIFSDEEVQREVERVTRRPDRVGDGAGRLTIHVGEDEAFDALTQVVPQAPAPEAHRLLVREIAVPARRLRRSLERLGLRAEPVRPRSSGHRLDRARLLGLVTRGEPRILVSRRLVRFTDLYLGVAIDCSSSMTGDSMERARAFGVLLAEATAGLRGVDLGLFGFTHDRVFDAGDADRPRVAGLEASGGNNDAGALDFVARRARRSRRTARMVVMVSDGLPTECTTEALKGLVRRLGRQGVLCAQVAVRPLEEVCFPHYVEIEGGDLADAARRFGRVVEKLVARSLGK
jgi:hypothetical protein